MYGQGTARDLDGAVADGIVALDQVLAHDGFACLNWHNYTFEAMSHAGTSDSWPPAMTGLVEYLRCQSPALWIPLPIELAHWCSRREKITVEAGPQGVTLSNTGPEDCDDFVVCFHYPAGLPHSPPAGAEALGQRGSRTLYALPVSIAAGQKVLLERL